LIHCKNFCKCPHSAQQQQLKKKTEKKYKWVINWASQ
jgi:hypothetical protein